VRKWSHLKDQVSLFPLSDQIVNGMQDLNTAEFPQSDDLISRNISCLIKLSWTDEQVNERAANMVAAIKSVL
jgi:8-amino-3,8-dideoxy-alpha-D-manno-octulosonate transaminase